MVAGIIQHEAFPELDGRSLATIFSVAPQKSSLIAN
jgi:hypothetical protein